MEKKSLRVLAFIFLIVLGIILYFVLVDKSLNTGDDSLKFKEEYEIVNQNVNAVQMNISEDNPIVYLEKYEELDKHLKDKDDFILYLGFPTCPWCRNIIPVLFDSAKENNIDKVYYINVRELKNIDDDYKSLRGLIDEHLEADEEGNKVLYVPEVFFFKDGKIIGHHLGSVDSQVDPTIPLTIDQITELKNIYSSYITKMK